MYKIMHNNRTFIVDSNNFIDAISNIRDSVLSIDSIISKGSELINSIDGSGKTMHVEFETPFKVSNTVDVKTYSLTGEKAKISITIDYQPDFDNKKLGYFIIVCNSVFANGSYIKVGRRTTDSAKSAISSLKELISNSKKYIKDSSIQDAHYILGGYPTKDDKMLKQDIAEARAYGVSAVAEPIGNEYQLVLRGSRNKLKSVLENYFGADATGIIDTKVKDLDPVIVAKIYNRSGTLLETRKFTSRAQLDNYVNNMDNFYDMSGSDEIYKNNRGNLGLMKVWKIIINDSIEEKNWTYIMYGTTGEFKVENISKREAEFLLKNNRGLGFDGRIFQNMKDKSVFSEGTLKSMQEGIEQDFKEMKEARNELHDESVKVNSIDELISKVRNWNGENITYYYKPWDRVWYFTTTVTLGNKYNYYGFVDKILTGRHDNPNVDLKKDEIHKKVYSKDIEELKQKVINILR